MKGKVKERPILFSGPMVRAILEERKIQTRRVVNPQPPESLWEIWKRFPNQKPCLYGEPGDRLWVRETWQAYRANSPEQEAAIKASIARIERGRSRDIVSEVQSWSMPSGEAKTLYAADFGDWAYDVDSDLKPWRPSIFMPRKLSRISLEIINVRVERLQEITEDDCVAEGVQPLASNLTNDGAKSRRKVSVGMFWRLPKHL